MMFLWLCLPGGPKGESHRQGEEGATGDASPPRSLIEMLLYCPL